MYHAPQISNRAKFDRISELATECGYSVAFIPIRHDRGWPTASSKPYHLQTVRGNHVASFATLEALERNLRARTAC